MDEERLRAKEWFVHQIDQAAALDFIVKHHYAKGMSNTATYRFGLFSAAEPSRLRGVAAWLPPTRVAAESVDKERWKRVLSLTRMAIEPGVPKNACSFLLARCTKRIKADKRFVALVTYADEAQEHFGTTYLAAGWEYVGRRPGRRLWFDPVSGKQVATLATKTRTVAKMTELGFVRKEERFAMHKFIKVLWP